MDQDQGLHFLSMRFQNIKQQNNKTDALKFKDLIKRPHMVDENDK